MQKRKRSDHIAIMKKSWGLIPKILSGEKTIESRWYQTRRVPWNAIVEGDTVYFKNSGEEVSAKAEVLSVLQFELKDIPDARCVIAKYGKQICLVNKDPSTWDGVPKYCILILLKNPKSVKPFKIDKQGFGNAAAWLAVGDIKRVKLE